MSRNVDDLMMIARCVLGDDVTISQSAWDLRVHWRGQSISIYAMDVFDKRYTLIEDQLLALKRNHEYTTDPSGVKNK